MSQSETVKHTPDSPDVPGQKVAGRGWVLLAVAIATFLLMLDLTVVNVALPNIQRSLDASFSELQWVLDSYALGLAVLVLASGTLGDRFGRKRIFVVGLITFTVASLLCGIAPSVEVLIAARALQGIAGAALFAIGPAILGAAYTGKDRGFAFGVFGAVSGIAIAFGPLIGGALTENASWHWIFLMNVPLGIIALLLTAARMKESRAASSTRLDVGGLISFSFAITALVFALMRAQEVGWDSSEVIAYFIASAVLFAVFLLIEWRMRDRAMVDLRLFRTPTMFSFSIVTLITGATVMASLFLLIAYVQNAWNFTAWETGVRFLPLTLTLTVAAAIAGGLTTKLPPNLLFGFSLTFIATGLFLTRLATSDADSWTSLLPSMIFIGLGMGLFNPPRASLSIAVVEPSKSGMGSGISETFQQVGVALGIAALGTLFTEHVKSAFLDSDVAGTLGDHASDVAEQVSTGTAASAGQSIPAALQQQIIDAAAQASTDGLHFAMTVAAWVAACGAVLGFTLIRRKDLFQKLQ